MLMSVGESIPIRMVACSNIVHINLQEVFDPIFMSDHLTVGNGLSLSHVANRSKTDSCEINIRISVPIGGICRVKHCKAMSKNACDITVLSEQEGVLFQLILSGVLKTILWSSVYLLSKCNLQILEYCSLERAKGTITKRNVMNSTHNNV